MGPRDERVDKAMGELKRVDDARLADLVDGRAANAMFEEVVGMTEPTAEEQREHARRGADERRPGWRRAWRVGVVAAVVAVAVGVLAIADPFGSNGLSVVQQAAAALTPPSGGILHVKMLGERSNPDGSVVTWSDESWQTTASPFERRQIEKGFDGKTVETATLGGATQLYDPAGDVIYAAPTGVSESPAPTTKASVAPTSAAALPQVSGLPSLDKVVEIDLEPGPTETQANVTIIAKVDGAVKLYKRTMSGRQAKMLVVAVAARNPDVTIGPAPDTVQAPADPAQASADPFRATMVALLRSGHVREDGRLTIDGREAIKLVNTEDGARETYIVDAATYAPIELRTYGDGGGTVLRFVTYETLPDTSANRSLLDVRAQHPGARIDTDAAHYQEASGRLFPNG